MWARNLTNLNKVPGGKKNKEDRRGHGVYVLFDGSMPVYVGKGLLRWRLKSHRTSKSKRELLDRFSWFVIADKGMIHDLEVLMLKVFPKNLRALTKQGGNFKEVKKPKPQLDESAEIIRRKS
jgi:hypothetical protein